jgi:hypothetical protein
MSDADTVRDGTCAGVSRRGQSPPSAALTAAPGADPGSVPAREPWRECPNSELVPRRNCFNHDRDRLSVFRRGKRSRSWNTAVAGPPSGGRAGVWRGSRDGRDERGGRGQREGPGAVDGGGAGRAVVAGAVLGGRSPARPAAGALAGRAAAGRMVAGRAVPGGGHPPSRQCEPPGPVVSAGAPGGGAGDSTCPAPDTPGTGPQRPGRARPAAITVARPARIGPESAHVRGLPELTFRSPAWSPLRLPAVPWRPDGVDQTVILGLISRQRGFLRQGG